jgi:hypothetical protein
MATETDQTQSEGAEPELDGLTTTDETRIAPDAGEVNPLAFLEETEQDEAAADEALELADRVRFADDPELQTEATAALAAVFAGDPQMATRRGNLLVAKYGHLEDRLGDVEATAAQEMARWELWRETQRAQIGREMDRVEMALLVYVTDWYPAKQRQVELPAGDCKRRKVPARIKLAPNDKLLEFIHGLPLEVQDGVTKMVETVQRNDFKALLTKTADGQALLDGEVVTRTVRGADGEPTEELLAWVEPESETFKVEPRREGRPTGDAVVLTRHARERFEERGAHLYEGEDPEERLAELAEDARGMCRRSGVQEIEFMGLVWCFAVDRSAWTLVTVKPGTGTPRIEESE